MALLFAAQANAASFTVGTTSDTTPGTACTTFPNGCSLRQLIEHENGLPATGSPVDTIVVPAGTYRLTSRALTITQSIMIAGAGARATTVAQTSADRVFEVEPLASGGLATVTISGLTISGGTAPSSGTFGFFGGDVQNVRDSLTLSQDWITAGTASSGGGVSNRGGSLTVTHSLVSQNQATLGGADSGGIQNYGDNTVGAGILEVDNSTVAYNSSHLGGGIFSWCGTTPCAANGANNNTTITSSTIAYNDGGTRSSDGGGLLTSAGPIDVESSIVAFNTVDTPTTGTVANCGASGSGSITSFFNHNMETGTDCGFTGTGDLQNTNPDFTSTAPQDNGGNTNTLGLSPSSPGVDAIGERQGCSVGTDQRDTPRPAGRGCDIGAFELVPTYGVTEGELLSGQLVPTDCPVVSMEITWGDGTQSAGTSTGQGNHIYVEEGTYNGSITWNTDDCGSGNYNSRFVVRVSDARLAASGGAFNATAGSAFTGQVARFTDADPNGSASDYKVMINWGDGGASLGSVASKPGGGFVVNGSHTYTHVATYNTTVSIADVGGSTATASGTATVGRGPITVFTGLPSVGVTKAGFIGSVNPEGLQTRAFFQYGLDPKYSGGGQVAYTRSTPVQSVGSDFSNHTVSASVLGLVPNAVYHVRLVAQNSAGTQFGPDVAFSTKKAAPPGAPSVGRTINVSVVNGLVLVKIHGQFIPLTELTQIPTNTVINALHGTIKLTTAGGGGGGAGARDAAAKKRKKKSKANTQTGTFGGAVFKVTQAKAGATKGLTTLTLVNNAFKGAPSYSTCKAHKGGDPIATAASSRTLQLLHASARGRFRTRGRYSAATVRGTKWTIADRCDGTLVHDKTDSVAVTDFVRHKTIILHAGQSYLASASRKHG